MKRKFVHSIFLFLALLLLVLPFLLTFNDVLTKLVEKFFLYKLLQDKLVPFQAYLVGLMVKPFVASYSASGQDIIVNGLRLKITWNCIGWQSMLLFLGSLVIALRGASFTTLSKIEAIVLGLTGIFWVNILRMSLTAILTTVSMPIYKIVFHDYLAAVTTVVFLLGFWWFSYSFVLEEK